MENGEALVFIKSNDNILGLKIENVEIENNIHPRQYDYCELGALGLEYERVFAVRGKVIELDKEGQTLFSILTEKKEIESFLKLPKQKLIEKLFLEEG